MATSFQSTLPRRERHAEQKGLLHHLYFNPRSREGSDPLCNFACSDRVNFNPRSREGSDGGGRMVAPLDAISIHAPAKGATSVKGVIIRVVAIFQSTLPRRERPNNLMDVHRCKLISIHAPAKGATSALRQQPDIVTFQSTLPRRERHHSWVKLLSSSKFQSTLPRRERRFFVRHTITPSNFNPRSREGSDAGHRQTIPKHHHFNPRSREGSDL